MSFSRFPGSEGDDLGPPPPPFRINRRRNLPNVSGINRWVALVIVLILLYIVLNTAKSLYIDWLWFDGVGFRSVYSKILVTRLYLFVGGALIFAVYFGLNLAIAGRSALRSYAPDMSEAEAASLKRLYLLGIIAGTLFFAVIFGTIAAGQWDVILRYLNREPFGVVDPQFGKDVGFYVFTLPALHFVYSWLMGAAILTTLAVAGLYLMRYLIVGAEGTVQRRTQAHLVVLLVVVVGLFIVRYWIDRYDLSLSPGGVVFGATYTDVHARLPFMYVGMFMGFVTIAALLASIFRGGITLPAAAMGLWVIVALFGNAIYPAAMQRFTVAPNELDKEGTYLQRNIEMTRRAFALDKIDEKPYPANPSVTQAEIDDNPDTIGNIRLLDVAPLLSTYAQIQTIRPLYEFRDVDVDRYTIDGVLREVMVSARELSSDRLPATAQSWVNKRLQFTHGYGAVMSPVNEVVQEGLPNLYLSDIPITGKIDVTQPDIYYGEEPDHYVIVKTNAKEFDYPSGDGNVQNVYDGGGGVGVGSLFRRLLFAWQFQDLNIAISHSLTSDSLILFHRNVQDRIHTLAPFLKLDHDPYLVIADGKLYWIQDAYTTTSNYPYSEPSSVGDYNYIRNSVKVVVNAYDGSTTFYLVDDTDPIVETYSRIFPKMFTPLDQMPASLQEHLRYPEDLFLAQVNQYRIYHITDPGVLYNREDVWNIPTETYSNNQIPLQPYYVIMRLPGETQAEFMLILPLTPARRQNTIAWVAARSDVPNYGQMIAFRFPTDSSVFGPQQVESRIDQNPDISSQFSLWNQSGSQVIRGNLLMIPIANGNIFVEPVYLQAASSQLPELKRVVVVDGDNIAMEPTLERSLEVIFGQAQPTLPTSSSTPQTSPTPQGTPSAGASPTPTAATPAATPTPGGAAPTVGDLARQANQAYQRAQEALKNGDFATYGTEIDQVEQLIQQIVQLTSNQP